MHSVIERDQGEKKHRDTIIKQFKRIDQTVLSKVGLGDKQNFDEDAVKSAYQYSSLQRFRQGISLTHIDKSQPQTFSEKKIGSARATINTAEPNENSENDSRIMNMGE